MLFVMKMKMKSRWDDDRSGPGRRPPVPPGRPPMPGQFPPNVGQGQGTPQRPPVCVTLYLFEINSNNVVQSKQWLQIQQCTEPLPYPQFLMKHVNSTN